MYKIHKKLLLFLFSVILLSFNLPVLALEIGYVNLPGVLTPGTGPGQCNSLPCYISYWFTFATVIGAAIAVVSLAWGGMQLILSAGSGLVNDAKDRMIHAVIGLVILMGCYLIIININPNIAQPSITALPGVDGVYYINVNGDTNDLQPAPMQEANTANLKPPYLSLYYKCDLKKGTPPTLLFWGYKKPNFQIDAGAFSGIIPCNIPYSVDPTLYASFQYDYEKPGIYFFTGSGCNGFRSQNITGDGDVAAPFNMAQSLTINNNQSYYGILLHSVAQNNGQCSKPVINSQFIGRKCIDIPSLGIANVGSINIFNWNNNPATSGNGVVFWSEPNGWTNERAGNNTQPPASFQGKEWIEDSASNLRLWYNGTATDAEKRKCGEVPPAFANFYRCAGSIQVKGSYLVIVRDLNNTDCKMFTKDVNNLKVSGIFNTAGAVGFGKIQVIPLQ